MDHERGSTAAPPSPRSFDTATGSCILITGAVECHRKSRALCYAVWAGGGENKGARPLSLLVSMFVPVQGVREETCLSHQSRSGSIR